MTIRYNTTRGDLIVNNARSILRNRFIMTMWSIVIAYYCFDYWREPEMQSHTLGIKVFSTTIFAVLSVLILFGITFVLTTMLILTRNNKGALGEHRITLTDEGLLESTDYNESLSRWSGYHKTVNTKSYLILYVTEGSFLHISKKRPLLEGDLTAFESALKAKTQRLSAK